MIPRSWRELAPGAYLDNDDALHIVTEELLRAAGVPDTPDNRQTVVEEVRRVLSREFPTMKFIRIVIE